MSDAQGWTLLALVGVLLSVIGGLIVNQFHLLRGYLDARFETCKRVSVVSTNASTHSIATFRPSRQLVSVAASEQCRRAH